MKVLVTAGPTREWLDPVRFLTNRSTGVMGYEIARAAKRMGLSVTLLSGPTTLVAAKGIRCISFETTRELEKLLIREFPRHDVLFMTAAVGDYSPISVERSKIKRKSALIVKFRQTPDLLAKLSKLRKKQIVVGFCLETENLYPNAMKIPPSIFSIRKISSALSSIKRIRVIFFIITTDSRFLTGYCDGKIFEKRGKDFYRGSRPE